MSKVSEEFIAAFCHGGSIVATCACGKTYFSGCSESNFDTGEYEDLCSRHKKEPDKCIELDLSHISVVNFGGNQYVVDCDCDGLAKYEAFIWRRRDEIIEYLKNRIANEYKLAKLANEKMHELVRADQKNQTISLRP